MRPRPARVFSPTAPGDLYLGINSATAPRPLHYTPNLAISEDLMHVVSELPIP